MSLLVDPGRPVLTLADLEAFDRYATANGRERRFCCPLCGDGKAIDPSHRSLSLNTGTGKWYCHRCGQGGILREHWTRQDGSAQLVAAQRAINGGSSAMPAAGDADLISVLNALAGVEMLVGSRGDAYLHGRGIPVDLALSASVAFHPAFFGRPAVVFLLFDRDGTLTAATGRHLDGGDPKAHTVGPKARTVFATPGAREGTPLVITEAPIDALSLAACGVPAVALCGTSWPDWLPGTCVFRRVALAFDADDAGDKAAEKLRPLLESFGAKVERWRPDGCKDWNEALTAGSLAPQLRALGIDPPATPSGANTPAARHNDQGGSLPVADDAGRRGVDPPDLPFGSFDTTGTCFGPTDPDGGTTRHAAPYPCRYSGCDATADGPWLPITPDCWQAECSNGHTIRRTAYSFEHPLSDPGRPPPPSPAQPLPLWIFDRLHPLPGIDPTPAPPDLTAEQVAAAVQGARAAFDRLVAEQTAPAPAACDRPAPVLPRFLPKPPEERPPDLVRRILAGGARLGWPALLLRPGERLMAGEDRWRTFVAAAPLDRLHDAASALRRLAGDAGREPDRARP